MLVRSEVLGQFVNTMTAAYKYFCQNLNNLPPQVQTVIFLRPKTFSRFFIALPTSALKLEYFEKKDQSHSLSITILITAKQVATYVCKRSSFMQGFGSQHVNGFQTLLRSPRNDFHTTISLI